LTINVIVGIFDIFWRDKGEKNTLLVAAEEKNGIEGLRSMLLELQVFF